MSGTVVYEAETCEDSTDGFLGRQRTYPHGFHFLEYRLVSVAAPPVIKVEPYQRYDFFYGGIHLTAVSSCYHIEYKDNLTIGASILKNDRKFH